MRSKKIFLTILALTAVACTKPAPDKDEVNLIGVKLEKVSSLSKADGTETEQVAVFDEVIRRIHQFQLSDFKYLKSYNVVNPDGRHVVLNHDQGNYVIDLCEKELTIFSRSGQVQRNPVVIVGQPLSAAFLSNLNLLVIYDDLSNVYMMQMNSDGQVLSQWNAGSRLDSGQSLTAGDLLPSGKLILGLTDLSIAVVDVAQSIDDQKWVYQTFPSNMANTISWVAPVSDDPNQIFVQAGDEVALFDVAAKTKLATKTIVSTRIEKLSKVTDGHVVIRSADQPDRLDVIYAHGSNLQERTLQKQNGRLLTSHLDAGRGHWTFVDMAGPPQDSFYYNDIDYTKVGRTLKRMDLATMGSIKKQAVVDEAQILISLDAIFALYPSDLGKATRLDLATGKEEKAELFNMARD